MEKGLPQDSVNALLLGRRGFVWIGTDEGLARFDGVDFEVFDRSTIPPLSVRHVTSLCESPDGTVWVGTNGGGVWRLKGRSFRAYGPAQGLPSAEVLDVKIVNGELWIGTADGAAVMRHGRFKSPAEAAALTGTSVFAICPDEKGGAWLGTSSGLYHWLEGRCLKVSLKGGQKPAAVHCLAIGEKGALFLGTGNGLYRWRAGAQDEGRAPEKLLDNTVRSLLIDHDGDLWVGTGHGIKRISSRGVEALTTRQGLPHPTVQCFLEDSEGDIWAGTNGGGLVRLKERTISSFTTTCGICSDQVWTIMEDREGDLWIGTQECLVRFAEGGLRNYTVRDGLPPGPVRSLLEDGRGAIWIGTAGGGAARLLKGQWRLYGSGSGLPNLNVLVFCETRDGTLWAGTDGGLATFDGLRWHPFEVPGGLGNNRVRTILEDKDGALWVGTYGGGLTRLSKGSARRFTVADGLAGENVWTLCEDRQGALWIGTGTGLSRFRDGRLKSLHRRDGLFSDLAYQILEGSRDALWISCNRGLWRVRRDALNGAMDKGESIRGILTFGVPDGMASSECNGGSQPAGWKAKDGKLWFATVRGAVVMDPMNLHLEVRPPPVVVEEILLEGQRVGTEGDCILPPGSKNLEIRYAGLELRSPGKVNYRYRMAGFQDEWREVGGRREATFSRLAPGEYRFEVESRWGDGAWNASPASVAVTMEPQFFQTTWFMGLCAMLLLLVGPVFYQVRMRRLRVRQATLARLVDERTHELGVAYQSLEAANTELRRISTQDPLTGLANRRAFNEAVEGEWRRVRRTTHPLSLLMIDIDHFKPYNDSLGHQQGDECLRLVADVLKASLKRAGDIAARYGGEEFAMVLTDTDEQGAAALAESIRARVEALSVPHPSSPVASVVTVCVGAATCRPSGDCTWGDVLAEADQALYEAKKSGRNRVCAARS